MLFREEGTMITEKQSLLPVLTRVTIFAGLREEWLARILAQGTIENYPEGAILLREGTPATEILVVLEGRVKVVLDLEHNPLEVCEFGAGSCVGEASVVGILEHSASVIVSEDTSALMVSRRMLMDFLATDTELFAMLILNIARELARRLHRTDEILLHYTGHHVGMPAST
ncbi:MAG: cyclic nucleotide-binding domain-containing protein [Chitinivibrionales bacterium]|nr:cyclic nucleotide-binding domain-containing protein [Chitinivibrionales bacterium]